MRCPRGAMSERPPTPNGDDEPAWDRLDDANQVSSERWDEIVSAFAAPSAVNSEVSADEVQEYLDEADDDWRPPEPEKVGWRNAPPALVISVAAFGVGLLSLIVGAVLFRPLPGFITLIALVLTAGGAVGLFYSLPRDRNPFDGDDGSQV